MCADNTTILLKLCQTIRKNNESNAISLVKVLLDKGARVDIQAVHGKTAADYAKRNGLKLIIMTFQLYVCPVNLDLSNIQSGGEHLKM
jgi:ankyrin repeat protein